MSEFVNPALEDLRWKKFPVLDDGIVALVDVMGTDRSVVQAARVSYGEGTKKVSDDRNLIRYLMRHYHTTPFEMAEMKFFIRIPMDTWRQMVRHRTFCLAEGTELYFDLPADIKKNKNHLFKMKIEDVFRKFQPTVNKIKTQQRDPFFRKKRVQKMNLRQMNEENRKIQYTNIEDVCFSGVKPVFKMILSDGKSIECSSDHSFLFSDGWGSLKDKVGLGLSRNNIPVWSKDDKFIYVNGVESVVGSNLYQDKDWLFNQYISSNVKIQDIADSCGVKYSTIRKWLKINGLTKPKGGRSKTPWNKGKSYKLGFRIMTDEQLARIRKARSGERSNFWKGGICKERESIGRWTSQVANKIHAKNNGFCQLCEKRNNNLHCHHIVPVWYDPSKSRDESNLTTVCQDCHIKYINRRELDYVDYFRERNNLVPLKLEKKEFKKKMIRYGQKAKLVKIKSFVYLGLKKTYDISVKGPFHNFIANGIVTHNSINETSTRYSIAIDSAQVTSINEWRLQSTTNNQGSNGFLEEQIGEELSILEDQSHNVARNLYNKCLEKGVAREQARKNLPLCTYTELYWKGDLHNIFHYLKLRLDEHAQYEIRCYANAIAGIVKQLFPLSYEAFEDYRLKSFSLTRLDIEVLNKFNTSKDCSVKNIRDYFPEEWKKEKCRERDEFLVKLDRLGIDYI